jgi:hypothetical protein
MAVVATEPGPRASDDRQIAEKKRLALTYLTDAWNAAMDEGVDCEILAHAALFTALAELIDTYGEEAVAELAGSLPRRIKSFEFSPFRSVQ